MLREGSGVLFHVCVESLEPLGVFLAGPVERDGLEFHGVCGHSYFYFFEILRVERARVVISTCDGVVEHFVVP